MVVGGCKWLCLHRANKHWLGDELMCHFYQKKKSRALGGACVDSCWPKIDWQILKTTQSISINLWRTPGARGLYIEYCHVACDWFSFTPSMHFLCFHQECFLSQRLILRILILWREGNKMFEIRTILENQELVGTLIFSQSSWLTWLLAYYLIC